MGGKPIFKANYFSLSHSRSLDVNTAARCFAGSSQVRVACVPHCMQISSPFTTIISTGVCVIWCSSTGRHTAWKGDNRIHSASHMVPQGRPHVHAFYFPSIQTFKCCLTSRAPSSPFTQSTSVFVLTQITLETFHTLSLLFDEVFQTETSGGSRISQMEEPAAKGGGALSKTAWKLNNLNQEGGNTRPQRPHLRFTNAMNFCQLCYSRRLRLDVWNGCCHHDDHDTMVLVITKQHKPHTMYTSNY